MAAHKTYYMKIGSVWWIVDKCADYWQFIQIGHFRHNRFVVFEGEIVQEKSIVHFMCTTKWIC